MSKVIFLVVSGFVLFSSFVFGQDSNPKKMNTEAEEAFYFENYRKSVELYTKLVDLDPDGSAYYQYQLGLSYLYSHLDNKKALEYLLKCEIELSESEIADLVYFHIGRAYHINNNFPKAMEYYDRVEAMIEYYDERGIEQELMRNIEMAINAVSLSEKPDDSVEIKNAGTKINSNFPDYKPLIAADESMMIYTSRKEGSTGGKVDKSGRYYEDIYVSHRDELGNWGDPTSLSTQINTELDEASVGLSADGRKLYIYKGAKKGGEIYVSSAEGDAWGAPEYIGSDVNTRFWETSASLSADGKTIYFVSDRKGSIGMRDIYKAESIGENQWGPAENLGFTVNTHFDEESPFIHPDGKTLYFASTGHNSMGGFDIFKSVYENGIWSAPENLGTPINSATDDFNYVLNASGKKGYFTSSRIGSLGEQDIFQANLQKGNVPLILVRGNVVIDGIVQAPGVKIRIIDKANQQEEKMIYQPDSKNGKYLMILPPAHEYQMLVEADGFKTHVVDIKMPKLDEFYELYQQIYLSHSGTVGQDIVVVNVFEDARNPINGDATLTEAAKSNNKEFIETLVDNISAEMADGNEKSLNDLAQENPKLIENVIAATDVVAEKFETPPSDDGIYATAYKSEYQYDSKDIGLATMEVGDTKMDVIPYGYNDPIPASTGTLAATETKPIDKTEPTKTSGEAIVADKPASTTTETKPTEEKPAVAVTTETKPVATTAETKPAAATPAAKPTEEVKELYSVYFSFDKSTLEEKYLKDVESAYNAYKGNNKTKFEVAGHTDSKGPEAYNVTLSQKRAEAVAQYLINKGIPKDNINIVGYGETQPISPNANPDGSDNPQGRKLNRRTEIKILK